MTTNYLATLLPALVCFIHLRHACLAERAQIAVHCSVGILSSMGILTFDPARHCCTCLFSGRIGFPTGCAPERAPTLDSLPFRCRACRPPTLCNCVAFQALVERFHRVHLTRCTWKAAFSFRSNFAKAWACVWGGIQTPDVLDGRRFRWLLIRIGWLGEHMYCERDEHRSIWSTSVRCFDEPQATIALLVKINLGGARRRDLR